MYASDFETEPRLPPEYPPLPVVRLTVAEYEQMVACGVFGDKAPFELLEGYLVPKHRKSPQHCYFLQSLRALLESRLPPATHCRSGGSVRLSTSEPEPDLAVVRGAILDYRERHPNAEETLLVVEFVDSALGRDFTWKNRGWKRRIYGNDRVRCYWLVDIAAENIEVIFPGGDEGDECLREFSVFDRIGVIPTSHGPLTCELPLAELFRGSPDA